MSKDENEDKSEFTFIKEQIIPKKKSKLKKVLISLGSTVSLALVFGVVARLAFVKSGSLVDRILGVDESKKQVSLSNSTTQDEGNYP